MHSAKVIGVIRKVNYSINFMIILFFIMILYDTTSKIADSFSARNFLEQAQFLPIIPSRMALITLSCMVLLALSNFLKLYYQKRNKAIIYYLLLVDFILCITVVYFINFSYRGLFLLLIMNIIYFVTDGRLRVTILILGGVLFITLDYDVLSNYITMVSMDDYIHFYSNQNQAYVMGFKNILYSVNDLGFIMFLYFLLLNKIDENKAIRRLNQELRSTASELELANIKLREYADEARENIKMKERNRLAREIHDILGHSLTSITTGIEASLQIMGMDVDLARKQLEKILELSRKGLVDVRRSVRELKIDSIAKYELIPAIEKLIDDINGFSHIKVSMIIEGTILKLKDDEEQTIYRTVQESITNSIRHGHASTMTVSLKYVDHELNIDLWDNGIGCDLIEEGFGLQHIRERIEMLGGVISYESRPNEGFKTSLTIPIRWGQAYD